MPDKLNHYYIGITLKIGRHEIVMDWLTPKEFDAFLYKLCNERVEFTSEKDQHSLVLHPEDIVKIHTSILETHDYEDNKIPNKETNKMTEVTTIAIGTVVRLKSGGPKMVVARHSENEDNTVDCHWLSNESTKYSAWFIVDTLEIVGDEFKEISPINQGEPNAEVEETELQETT